MSKKNNWLFLFLAIFFGLIIGNILGIALQNFIPVLAKGAEAKLIVQEINLIIFSISISIVLKISLGGVLGALLGLYLYFSN